MIENTNSSTNEASSFEVCQRSGFKVKRGTLILEKHSGLWVAPQFAEPRHPQEFVRSRSDKQRGALKPEPIGNERFLSNGEVTADNL